MGFDSLPGRIGHFRKLVGSGFFQGKKPEAGHWTLTEPGRTDFFLLGRFLEGPYIVRFNYGKIKRRSPD